MNVTATIERSDGKTFDIDDVNWRIPSNGLDGFGAVENDISTADNAIGDGSIYTGSRIGEKDRTIIADYVASDSKKTVRSKVCRFFVPRYTFKVYLTYFDVTRWCEGRLYKFSITEKNVNNRLQLQFTLLCTDPFLRSDYDYGKDITSITPMRAFPFLCAANGIPASYFNTDMTGKIINNGDVETTCKVVISASDSATGGYMVKNPYITINDKTIKFNSVLMEYGLPSIIIDMSTKPLRVYNSNGVNMIGYLTTDSDLTGLELDVGENTITCGAEAYAQYVVANLYYNELFTTM